MRATRIGLAIVLALTVQTTLTRYDLLLGGQIDLVLVVVVSSALSGGPVVGLWTGTVGGLIQDVLSGGLVGVSGLAKSIIGFLVGVVGAQFLVSGVWHRLVILMLATIAHALCFFGVYELLESVGPVFSVSGIAIQAAANAGVGVGVAALVQFAPGAVEHGRLRRGPFSRRWTAG